ncbi:MAG: TRAP transporter large permease subunit, partial [Pseudomonadota bacterium]
MAVTGTFTIPLMKKLGYRPEMAAAVEATASVGGIVTPPIMGSVAFIMADFLEIPYYKIVIAAIIPALLYYGAILIQVDLEAARTKMKGLPADQIPKMGAILRPNWPYLIPLAVILFTLMVLYWRPAKAGMAACITTVIVILLRVKGQ